MYIIRTDTLTLTVLYRTVPYGMQVYVTKTDKRPVPLTHYLTHDDEMYKLKYVHNAPHHTLTLYLSTFIPIAIPTLIFTLIFIRVWSLPFHVDVFSIFNFQILHICFNHSKCHTFIYLFSYSRHAEGPFDSVAFSKATARQEVSTILYLHTYIYMNDIHIELSTYTSNFEPFFLSFRLNIFIFYVSQ